MAIQSIVIIEGKDTTKFQILRILLQWLLNISTLSTRPPIVPDSNSRIRVAIYYCRCIWTAIVFRQYTVMVSWQISLLCKTGNHLTDIGHVAKSVSIMQSVQYFYYIQRGKLCSRAARCVWSLFRDLRLLVVAPLWWGKICLMEKWVKFTMWNRASLHTHSTIWVSFVSVSLQPDHMEPRKNQQLAHTGRGNWSDCRLPSNN